ncbi:YggT family protein [Candidatus Hepatobacter penaei]|uniref:YggT family protein n=1 Tax=Candidatus Hepatobacter penaei TaxID=1274402 RepID=UPI0004F2EDF1|nr:YggT family protein [Candidatus Hepatobacter penaei]TGW15839.1 YggT family protein [bacterium NHP-B]
MDIFLLPFLEIVNICLTLMTWVIIIGVALNWLTALQILNAYSPWVSYLSHLTYALTEPLYERIRRLVPMIGTVDLSPLILLLLIRFLRTMITHAAARYFL